MKKNMKYVIPLIITGIAAAAACIAGPAIIITPPTVVVSAPPVVAVSPAPIVAPDYYTWDGYEYVGMIGDQYYYLGPGNVWMVMDPTRLHRFQGWQRGHADWRAHATHNVLYRNARPYQPHAMPGAAPAHGQPMATPQHTDHSDHYPPQ